MSSCLQLQSLKCFYVPTNVKIYDFHDNLFIFYSEKDSKIHYYDIKSLICTTLELAATKTKSDLTSIAISPSHTIVAFGYTCGTIQLFSLQAQKVVKSILRVKGVSVLSLIFVMDDYLLASSDDSKITGYRITSGRITGTSYREIPITTLKEPVIKLTALPLYQYVSDLAKPRCVSTQLEGLFAYRTMKYLAVADVSSEFEVIYEQSYISCVYSFSAVNNDEISLGIATPTSIEVLKIAKRTKVELAYFYEINFSPNFISFLAPTIFLVIYDKVKGYLFSITQNTKEFELNDEIHNERIPFDGVLVNGRNIFYLFGKDDSFKISMITFFEIINQYKEEGKFQEAVDFCKRAIEGDYRATVGLPFNHVQRNIRIEETMTSFLESKCRQDLDKKLKPSEVATNFIKLSKKLKFHNWMISTGLKIFNEYKFLHEYFQEIIANDVEANFFSYNKEFVNSLLKNSEKLEINSFLLLLPRKASQPQELIQFAKEKNDIKLIANIMIQKLNDFVDAAAVFSNANDSENLCDLFHNNLYPSMNDQQQTISLISWLFGIKKSDNDTVSFPHLICMLKYNNPLTLDTLAKIQNFIKLTGKPFSLDEFVNAILLTLSQNQQLKLFNKIFEFAENVILNCNVQITNNNLPIVFSRIFTNTKSDPDNREALLVSIINGNYPIEFKDMLLPLCDNFEFKIAKRQIQIETNRFDSAFKEVICNPNEDIFAFIRAAIRNDEKSLSKIYDAMVSNATYLIKKNVGQFVHIIRLYFPDLLTEVIDIVTEDDTRNYYIKHLLNYQDISEIKLSKNIAIQFCNFLCRYYPGEVHKFLETQRDNLTDFFSICKEFNVFDGCAIIADYTNDINQFTHYLSEYFKVKMILFVDSRENSQQSHAGEKSKQLSECSSCELFEEQLQFVCSKIEKAISKRSRSPGIYDFCKIMTGSFVLPFFSLQTQENEKDPLLSKKEEILKHAMKKICVLVANVIPFSVLLEHLVTQYENIYVDYTRPTFLALINDAAYDLQTTTALAQLFHQDEQDAHNKYILKQVKGTINRDTVCDMCGGILNGMNCCVRLFPCGHTFHDNETCLPKQICPICNPEVRIDQDVERPIFAIHGNQVQKRLKRFEFMVHRKQCDFSQDRLTAHREIQKKGSIRICRISKLEVNEANKETFATL